MIVGVILFGYFSGRLPAVVAWIAGPGDWISGFVTYTAVRRLRPFFADVAGIDDPHWSASDYVASVEPGAPIPAVRVIRRRGLVVAAAAKGGHMRGDTPGGPIRWRMHLAVPPTSVYAALDSDAGRRGFWAESADEVNGHVRFRFVDGTRYDGKILRREPPDVWAVEYFGGEARFELTADGVGGTDLLLCHAGVEVEVWQEDHAGWLNVLFPLKAFLVHGVDLRNHDPARTWNEGYADQ